MTMLTGITTPRVELSTADLAWQAGILEGEGYIAIQHTTTKALGFLQVTVNNCLPEIPATLNEAWGGHLSKRNATQPNHRDYWIWSVSSWNAASFLLAVEPYLRTDHYRRKTGHALNYQHQKTRTHESRTTAYHDRQDWYYQAMRQMNERGTGAAANR